MFVLQLEAIPNLGEKRCKLKRRWSVGACWTASLNRAVEFAEAARALTVEDRLELIRMENGHLIIHESGPEAEPEKKSEPDETRDQLQKSHMDHLTMKNRKKVHAFCFVLFLLHQKMQCK